MLDDDISREVQRLDADMDRFIKAQVTHSSFSGVLINVIVDTLREVCNTIRLLNQVMLLLGNYRRASVWGLGHQFVEMKGACLVFG